MWSSLANLVLWFYVASAFRIQLNGVPRGVSILSSTWQKELDSFLDVDVNCDARIAVAKSLGSKVNEIAADVIDAVLDRE